MREGSGAETIGERILRRITEAEDAMRQQDVVAAHFLPDDEDGDENGKLSKKVTDKIEAGNILKSEEITRPSDRPTFPNAASQEDE